MKKSKQEAEEKKQAVWEQELLFQFTQQSHSGKNWSFLPRAAILQKQYSGGKFQTNRQTTATTSN